MAVYASSRGCGRCVDIFELSVDVDRCWAARFKGVEVRCVELSYLCVVCVWFGAAAGVVVRRMSDNTVSCVTELSSVTVVRSDARREARLVRL